MYQINYSNHELKGWENVFPRGPYSPPGINLAYLASEGVINLKNFQELKKVPQRLSSFQIRGT